jgi:hypothetical protein
VRKAFLQPRMQLRINAGLALLWAVLLPPALLWWRDSVPFLVLCSVYANLAGHVAGVAAAAGARHADPGDDL